MRAGAWFGAGLFLRSSPDNISVGAAPNHRPIASLWRAHFSIASSIIRRDSELVRLPIGEWLKRRETQNRKVKHTVRKEAFYE
jgi:hypothetical protein